MLEISCSKKKIKCTLNHKILTSNGYKEANTISMGDIIYCKYDIDHDTNIIAPKLNPDQLQVILGSYFGDGCIRKTAGNRSRMSIIHCEKQQSYCIWKSDIFNVNNIQRIENNGYSQKPAYRFNTKIFDLPEEYDITGKLNEKIINTIDLKGIAIWIMDDGSLTNKNYTLHSNSFNYEEHKKIVELFKKYNLSPNIKFTKNKYWYLYFSRNDTRLLSSLIAPYVHSSMNYKLLDVDKLIEKYSWVNKFENIGTLKVTNIKEIINKPANRCKIPYVYDIEVEDYHYFIIGTKYMKGPNYIDGIIVHNCHHISAEVFCRSLFKIVTPYMLGLSATMNRKDGLTKVFKMFLGDVVYKEVRETDDKVLVRALQYKHTDPDFSETLYNFKGQTHYALMIRKLCEFNNRSEFILKVLQDLLEEDTERQVMILAHNKSLLKYLYDAVEHRNIASVGYYVGGMKEAALKETESKKVVIATYAMAEEALDIRHFLLLF